MKAKVLKAFIDKHTGEYHKPVPDKVIDVTEERAKEILASGAYIELVKDEKPSFEDMTVKMLKTYAEENGIDISSAKNKAEILEIIKQQP